MPRLDASQIDQRAALLFEGMAACRLCPHICMARRHLGEIGRCRAGMGATVVSATPHFGEEPEISGTKGSGTLFFAGCNLRCLYCQNAQISQEFRLDPQVETPATEIAAHMLRLQDQGCHNINLVSPSHVIAPIVRGLAIAVDQGLQLPVIYNTNAFDDVETLHLLEGIVDIYLPDLRYADNTIAWQLSGAKNYVESAQAAILEMARQTGVDNLQNEDGLLQQGLIIRLLVLPNDLAEVTKSLDFLAENLPKHTKIALLNQYYPTYRAHEEPLLTRPPSPMEYAKVVDYAENLKLTNLLLQEEQAQDFYRPDFDSKERPFRD